MKRCVLIVGWIVAVAAVASAQSIEVRQPADGLYAVSAHFDVPQSPAVVREVLTDYANLPRFVPDIRRSVIRDRTADGLRVEQEAVSKYMLFSKRVHVLLEVREEGNAITFKDQCGKSFERYEGAWHLTSGPAGTELRYELTAKPAFSVPQFLIGRVLERDAREMIDRLRAEMARRAAKGE